MNARLPASNISPDLDRGTPAALLWACFLGSSWTWIIGMVLPILLVRDLGFWGWFAFAIPNVVGAAAMGFVLSNAGASRRLVEQHRDMGLRFSEVTIAYHGFVLAWLYTRLLGWWAPLVALAIVLPLTLMSERRPMAKAVAAVVSIVSFVCFIVALLTFDGPVITGGPLRLSALDLIAFIPAAIVGFALCPYLDLTFHRARQSTTPGTGKAAFALGFGVVFFTMIIFTLVYASRLEPLFTADGIIMIPRAWWVVLAIHLTLQAGYTVALHAREMRQRLGNQRASVRVVTLLAASIVLGIIALQNPSPVIHGIMGGEVVYRLFLLAYGLAFPLYVWLCIALPNWRKTPATRAHIITWAFATIVGLPCAWLAFIAAQPLWMGGVILVFLAGTLAVFLSMPRSGRV